MTQLLLFVLSLGLSWTMLFVLASQTSTTYSNLIAQERDWGGITKRSDEWQKTDQLPEELDVLFVGSSTCYSSIDPAALEAYGYNGFSFCSSAQVPDVSIQLARTVLEESSAQTVVLDLYNWHAESVSLEPTRDWVLNTSLWDKKWRRTWRSLAIQTWDPYTVILSWAYPIIRKFRLPGKGVPEDQDGIYRGLGFIGRTYPPLEARPICTYRDIETFEELTCNLFREMSEVAEDRHVIFVMPPLLCPLGVKRPDCIPPSSWILGQEWPDASQYHHYYDDHHLVESGARKYSAWLAGELANRIPDSGSNGQIDTHLTAD